MTWVTAITMAYDFGQAIKWGFDKKFSASSDPDLHKNSLIIGAFIMDFIVACLMSAFLKFHLMLASTNKTTIENIDKMGKQFISPYDVGPKENWKQIFGAN